MKNVTFSIMISLAVFGVCHAEQLIVPHVATDTISFRTNLILENRSDDELTVTVSAFLTQTFQDNTELVLAARSRGLYNLAELFPGKAISHLILNSNPGLFGGVEFVPLSNDQNRTYVEAIRSFSERWRIHPSNWNTTFDGISVVNPTCYQADLLLVHYDKSGSPMSQHHVREPLGSFHKALFNLLALFPYQDASYVEITASAPIAVVGLKGTLKQDGADSFLVGNQAEPYPAFELERMELLANKALWLSHPESVNYAIKQQYSCFCPPTRAVTVTVQNRMLSSLTYSDDGTDVEMESIKEYYTVMELFDLIDASLTSGHDRVTVLYDRETGLPTQILLDPSSCTVDEEINLSTSLVTAEE